MQQEFAISFSSAPKAQPAAEGLARSVEAMLGGPQEVAGGCVLATAASGHQAQQVGAQLSERWPEAELVGTSFEGLIAEGQTWRDGPGLVLLAWRATSATPLPLYIEADEPNLERLADEILEAFPMRPGSPNDLLLLFPDAQASPALESLLPSLIERIGPIAVAGAAASGADGERANAWVAGEPSPGACIGILLPGMAQPGAAGSGAALGVAAGSRLASPWMEVTKSRPRWIDEISGRSALAILREEIGLSRRSSLEPHLDRLLVRYQGRRRAQGKAEASQERYIVGLDEQRGAFSLPIEVEQGGRVALAWPDASLAREALRTTYGGLAPSPFQLQFACRARDQALHGDADLESAWVAAEADARPGPVAVVGTVGPFQLASAGDSVPGDSQGGAQRLVHSTVLVSLQVR